MLNLPLQRTIGACIAEAMAPRIIGRDATAERPFPLLIEDLRAALRQTGVAP